MPHLPKKEIIRARISTKRISIEFWRSVQVKDNQIEEFLRL